MRVSNMGCVAVFGWCGVTWAGVDTCYENVLRASEKCLTREAAEGPAAVQQSMGRAIAQIAWCRKIGSSQ